jgi:hypothetical protein
MNKTFINTLIKNLQKSGMVTNITPWVFEGIGDRKMEVRYVGLKLNQDWEDLISSRNNILIKCLMDKPNAFLEMYIANKPPFFRFWSTRFTTSSKWETILGEVRQRIRKDKEDSIRHQEKAGNLYILLQK